MPGKAENDILQHRARIYYLVSIYIDIFPSSHGAPCLQVNLAGTRPIAGYFYFHELTRHNLELINLARFVP